MNPAILALLASTMSAPAGEHPEDPSPAWVAYLARLAAERERQARLVAERKAAAAAKRERRKARNLCLRNREPACPTP